MEDTTKGIEVIAYKGMNSDMTCKGFQYEIGETYKTDKVELCECGFHACLNPIHVLDYYYPPNVSRYFKVKLYGEIANCDESDTKVAATEITILEEINIDEVIETTEWWKNNNVLDLLPWSEGFAKIQRGDYLFNFIDKNGNILSKEWFRYVSNFHEGFAGVQGSNRLYNFIDKDGNILSNEWFNYLGDFHNGFAKVQRTTDKLWNFIDKEGRFLSNEWFYCIGAFNESFIIVQRENDLYNFIDKKGNYLSDEWFIDAYDFHEGFAIVEKTNGEWCKLYKKGEIIKKKKKKQKQKWKKQSKALK